jgi:hypothetical protein
MKIKRFGCLFGILIVACMTIGMGILLYQLTRGFYVKNHYEVADIDLLRVPNSGLTDLVDGVVVPAPITGISGLNGYLTLRVQCRIFSDSSKGTHKLFGTWRCCGDGIQDSICAIQWLRHPLADCSPALHGTELARQSSDSASILAAAAYHTVWSRPQNTASFDPEDLRSRINHSEFFTTQEESDELRFYTFPDHLSRRQIQHLDHVGIRFHFQSGRQMSAWLAPHSSPTELPPKL